ncbi:MAG: glycoside hydrolase family 88 protein, partial [Prevotella sp.]|nr:glycoside hydrolase family 88 protein [Prevotella sp.]
YMRLKHLLLLLMAIVSFSTARAATDGSDFKFNDGVRYSQWAINSRLNSFCANTANMGLAVYDENGNTILKREDGGKTKLDYVPGLVAKGIIEAVKYYQQYTWAAPWVKPWFLSVADYGNKWYNVSEAGGSLDDLNGVKLYMPLSELASTGGAFPDNTAYNNAVAAIGHAVNGLKAHNDTYVIGNGTLAGDKVAGGWWHKAAYNNQMWLDGQYMGPALLAQIINHNKSTANISADDWKIIIRQLDAVWQICWNSTDKLMYHAFEANGGTETTFSHAEVWSGLSASNLHSASYWGRACGWYFLALVDILHEMDNAKSSSQNTYTNDDYTRIKSYLTSLAEGLKARQDTETGGWYQILDKDGKYSASEYNNGQSHTQTYNYIESSATAIFAAAYLKAIRLGYLAESEYGETARNAYKCIVNNFFAADGKDGVHIFGSCRSAGLGSDKTDGTALAGKKNFRDGSNEYYLLGYDVTRVAKSDNETEGKVLGAFILASTEYEQLYQKDKILFSKDLAPAYPLTSADTSISIEAFGADNIEYRWYNVNDENTVVATTSTFTPTASGSYYCTATAGSETITSSTTNVTVEEKGNTTYEIWFAKIADGERYNITENTTYFSGLDGISSSSSCNSIVTIDGTEYVITGRSSAQDPNISFDVKSGTGTLYMLTASNSTSNDRTFTLTNTVTQETKTAETTAKNTICRVTFENIPEGSYTLKADGKIYLGFLCMKLSDGSGLTLTITYDKNIGDDVTVSGMPAQVSVLDGKIVLPETAPTADGYTFCGWYKEQECINKANTGDVIGSDITLYAKWRKNSDLALKKSVAWTPAVNGTIALGDLVSSSSTGDYTITSGNDIATFDNSTKTFTALKPGSFVLEQAEDATYAKGFVHVYVAIGTDVATNDTNAYTVGTDQTYSDGITVACEDITMTFGNDGFWTSGKSYTQGQNNPSPGKGAVPTSGTYYKFEPRKGGSLAVKISIGVSRQLYVVESDGTLIAAKDNDGNVVTVSASEAGYTGDVSFNVAANKTYYVYVDGAKANFYGFTFTPSAETPVDGNVIAT